VFDRLQPPFAEALVRQNGKSSTPWAPWYVIPAAHKGVTQALVAQVLVETVRSLDLRWPEVSAAEHAANLEARRKLEAEEQDDRS